MEPAGRSALGAAGSDGALETADVALMADDLAHLPFAVGLSRSTRAIIRQNVFVSLGVVAAAFISNIPEGLGSTAGLVTNGKTTRDIVLLWVKVIVISGVSAAAGYLLLDDASPNLGAFAQSFAAGAMLTMIVDTMIPEAFEEGGKVSGLVTVLGFSVAVLISSYS